MDSETDGFHILRFLPFPMLATAGSGSKTDNKASAAELDTTTDQIESNTTNMH